MLKIGKVILDFNKACNPYCALNPYSSCPIPPKQNTLLTRVEGREGSRRALEGHGLDSPYLSGILHVPALFSGIERAARFKLDRLEAAVSLKDLAALPGNRFEALGGDRKGQYSIRVNDQWRVCFEWPAKWLGPMNVEIVDYH